jgi:NAD(P)-dependent dehydrogenase (short-subunit alcohol dehydrogenase family)
MKNKNILITGGTTGIGLAAAQLLSAEGANVIVTGRKSRDSRCRQKNSDWRGGPSLRRG